MDDPMPPDYQRAHGPPGTVEIAEDEEDYDAEDEEEEEELGEWGVTARISLSPRHVGHMCHMAVTWSLGVVCAVLLTALVTQHLL